MIIELNEKEAELFKVFRKYQDKIAILHEAKFFDIRGATGTVDFDGDNNIRKVESITVRFYNGRNFT